MQEPISLTVSQQRRAVAAVTTVTIPTLQDVPVSLVEVTTTLLVENVLQAAARLATATTIQVLLEAAEHSAVAQTAAATVRLQVPLLLLQVKVEAHQAAVVINS